MRKIAIALLATSMIGAPVFAVSKHQQQPQANQQQTDQTQQNQQPNQQQAAQDNQTQAPNLPRREIRQVQRALNKDGFKVGRADGRWGPETENAVKQFQQSKQIEPSGQLDQQTMADLGLDKNQSAQPQGSQTQQK
jgi:peptidoglycan hydrolase-like protein with peptidoglycan-binding domain